MKGNTTKFATIKEAIEDIKAGKFAIVLDDENRENEGDLVISAEKVTPEKINFMIKYGGGLICLPINGKRLDELRLPQMVPENNSLKQCAFTVSIDVINGATTGVSAYDRTATIKAVLNPNAKPEDFRKPGHMFPLRYKDGGVLERQGHTEAAVDLAILSGLSPAAVICEILDEHGNVAKLNGLIQFSKKNNIRIISINDLIEYRETNKLK